MIHEYGGGYLHLQVYDNRGLYDLGEHVRAITRPDDVVLVWGMDWSPELSWAAKRRALMDYADRDPMSETMVQALEALRAHSYQVKALVFCGRERDEAFVDKRLAVFPGFRRVYESPNSCDLYGTD